MRKMTIILLFGFASLFIAPPVFADPPPPAGDDVLAFHETGDRAALSPAEIDYGPAHVWTGPDGTPLPFKTADEIKAFLLTASPTSAKTIRTGVNRPKKVLLQKNGLQLEAIFRYQSKIDVTIEPGQPTQYFRDSYLGEIAAYEMNHILGLDNMPPTVLRTIGGREGTLQLWAEQTTPYRERLQDKVLPPEARPWNRQMSDMYVFDNVINNIDRNQTNILIDENWQMILIDHTRSFARDESLFRHEKITRCSRGLWHALRHLDEAQVKERLSPYLKEAEIESLFVRRDLQVELIQDLIDRNGEEKVLY